PRAGISCAFCSTIDGITGEVMPNAIRWTDEPAYLTPDELVTRVGRNSIPGHNAVIKRNCYEEAGGHRSELEWLSDWFLNFSVAFRHGLCFIPETIALFRYLPTSYSSAGFQNRAKMIEIAHRVFDLLASPGYADLLPYFQKCSVMGPFGTDLLFAAAARSDGWGSHIMSLINGLRVEEYESLLETEDLSVREFAKIFARTLAPSKGRINQLQLHLEITQAEVRRVHDLIKNMENTKVWQ